jgi:ankyrin repeat protein
MKFLIEEAGSDVNAKTDYGGNSVLHLAALFSTLEMVKYLVEDVQIG